MIATQRVSVENRLRIEDLYAEYAACLDDARFEAWPDYFTQDCSYRIVARENYDRGLPLALLACESRGMLVDRVYGITQTLFHEPYYQRHIVSGLIVTAEDDGYRVRANYVVVQTKVGALPLVYSAGRYVDRVVEVDGSLRFAEKLCIFDSELIANSMIYPI